MPVSLFGMLPITTARQRFTCVGHILQPQLPTAVRLAVATSPHGSVARLSGGGYSVPSASHPGVTPNARLGRVPVAEHRISISLINTRATSCRTSPVGVESGRIFAVAKGCFSRSRGENLHGPYISRGLPAFAFALQCDTRSHAYLSGKQKIRCSATGTLPGRALGVTLGCEALGTL